MLRLVPKKEYKPIDKAWKAEIWEADREGIDYLKSKGYSFRGQCLYETGGVVVFAKIGKDTRNLRVLCCGRSVDTIKGV